MKVAIGLPAYNEEKNIAKLIVELQKISDQIIVCNDGSTDLTGPIAEKLGTILINHSRNLGYGAAIRSLFLKARELNCDVLVTFDSDGQHKIEDISSVVKPVSNGEADIVIGSRFLDKESELPKYREVGIKAITKITNFSTKKNLTDSQSGFRAYNKKAFSEITPSESGMGVSTEILIKANKKGLKITEVPTTITYGNSASTHSPVSHGFSVILSTMKFTSIEHPLKFYGMPGIIFLIIGLFFIVWTIQGFAETRQIITNITLIGIGTTILGSMLLLTSIILYSLVSIVREKR